MESGTAHIDLVPQLEAKGLPVNHNVVRVAPTLGTDKVLWRWLKDSNKEPAEENDELPP